MTSQSTGQYLITADTRRGTISLVKNPNDGLLHFTWADRDTGNTEDDRMLFPDEAVWKKVNTGRAGDRVFLLQLKSSNQVLMFWMQDKSAEKDDEVVTKINNFINNPSSVDAAIAAQVNDSAAASDSAVAAAGPGGLNQESWLRAMGITPAPAVAAPAPVPGHFNNLDLSSLIGSLNSSALPVTTTPAAGLTAIDLQRAMMGITATPSTAAAATPSSSAPRVVLAPAFITSQRIISSGILTDEASKSKMLLHLPEDRRNDVALLEITSSEPFLSAVDSLLSGVQPNATGSNTIRVAAVVAADDSAAAKVAAEAVRAYLSTLDDDATPATPMEM